jgi:2-polyprenyl-3-methyl-5-hydroxy-6-metoxy-1,4-benzoquinol methylase
LSSPSTDREFGPLLKATRRIWDTNAEWWDDRIGDGNDFQCRLIEPATERLLSIRSGDVVLDVACGAGRFARRMAEMGAHVVAFDLSRKFILRAKRRTPEGMNVEYHVIDATKTTRMLTLGRNRFDWATCTMALMDMPAIRPLFRILNEMLKPGRYFVFSVIHPCFDSPSTHRYCEQYEQKAGRLVTETGVKISQYLTPFARKSEGIIGQPVPQYYFHRPLQVLLEAGFDAGFLVDRLEEPRFASPKARRAGVRWADMPEIPPVLVVRMRLDRKNRPQRRGRIVR